MDPGARLEYIIPGSVNIRRCSVCWVTWHYASRELRDRYPYCPICSRHTIAPRRAQPHTALAHPEGGIAGPISPLLT